ncbi:hypothetical protein QQ045_006428 [Rhodiola kirilowii]
MELFNKLPYNCPKSARLDINYQSISVPNLCGSITLTRKLKNVNTLGIYRVHLISPPGISIKVHPRLLKFHKIGEEKSFKVTLRANKHNLGQRYVFGKMTLFDGKHFVRSPIAANVIQY